MLQREGKGPIQRIAQGLLGFFQLKDQGNPAVLSDLLQGTLELRDWYFETSTTVPAVSTVSIPANSSGWFAFTTNPLVVPQNEIWWVSNFTVYCALPLATDHIRMCPGFRDTVSSADFALSQMQVSDLAGQNSALTVPSTGFFLMPGQLLGVFIGNSQTVTNITVIGALRFIRIPV
jgi:hypothetical protein